MELSQRIRLCRILEKMERQSGFSRRLGLVDGSTIKKTDEKEKSYDL